MASAHNEILRWNESRVRALEPVASALAKNICIMCIPLNRISLSKKKKKRNGINAIGITRGAGTNFSFKGIENFRIYRDGIIMKIHFGIETKDILPKWLREEGDRGIFKVENCIYIVFLSFFFLFLIIILYCYRNELCCFLILSFRDTWYDFNKNSFFKI